MTPEALTALKASIVKWDGNAAVTSLLQAKVGVDNCPLCRMFYNDLTGDPPCIGCPIMERTGEPYCRSTPYEQADIARDRSSLKLFVKAAAKEAAFLRSLLPDEPLAGDAP